MRLLTTIKLNKQKPTKKKATENTDSGVEDKNQLVTNNSKTIIKITDIKNIK